MTGTLPQQVEPRLDQEAGTASGAAVSVTEQQEQPSISDETKELVQTVKAQKDPEAQLKTLSNKADTKLERPQLNPNILNKIYKTGTVRESRPDGSISEKSLPQEVTGADRWEKFRRFLQHPLIIIPGIRDAVYGIMKVIAPNGAYVRAYKSIEDIEAREEYQKYRQDLKEYQASMKQAQENVTPKKEMPQPELQRVPTPAGNAGTGPVGELPLAV